MTGNGDVVTAKVVDAALKIHRQLGPGLLEAVYETVLAAELTRRGLHVERQRALNLEYDGIRFRNVCRVDLIVGGEVVVEVKSKEQNSPVHKKQVLTYLRLLGFQTGLVINFGCAVLKDGLTRVVNNYRPSDQSLLRINRPKI